MSHFSKCDLTTNAWTWYLIWLVRDDKNHLNVDVATNHLIINPTLVHTVFVAQSYAKCIYVVPYPISSGLDAIPSSYDHEDIQYSRQTTVSSYEVISIYIYIYIYSSIRFTGDLNVLHFHSHTFWRYAYVNACNCFRKRMAIYIYIDIKYIYIYISRAAPIVTTGRTTAIATLYLSVSSELRGDTRYVAMMGDVSLISIDVSL